MREFLYGSALIMQIIYSVVLYLAGAVSLYLIAKRNNVKGKWLAFLPILQYYIIGALCEEYIIARRRIRFLQWIMPLLALLQIYFSMFSGFFFVPATLVANILMALFLHKFFYLFVPSRATLYAVLSLLGRLPFVIILFLMKDKPMVMSAGAYPYPFGNQYYK